MKRSSFAGMLCLVAAVALSGCVTTKEYNARLADIDVLRSQVASLEGKLKTTTGERDGLAADLAKLRKDHDNLQKAHDDLTKQNKALEADNTSLKGLLNAKKDELSAKISELRGKLEEKDAALAAKQAEIDGLTQQVLALTRDKDALTLEKETAIKEKERSIAEMRKTYDSLMGEMNEEIKKGEITITQLKDKVSVNLVEKILFDSGSAEIKKDGKKVLDRVADILKKVSDKQIRVSGHTDNVPIGYRIKERFPSNWELSTARATTVSRYLQDKGIDPAILSASGYSEYRPVASNDTEEGRSRNRRIEIDLVPKETDKIVKEGGQ